MKPTQRAVFLDRDGVINRDTGYVSRIADFEWLDGVIEALHLFKRAGFLLVIVTNQSGIGRGYYTEQAFLELTAEMRRVLLTHNLEIAHVAFCPHLPAKLTTGPPCSCRKPLPGMLLESARLLDVDLSRSIMIGDNPSDIAAGRAAGVKQCILVGVERASAHTDAVYPDLLAAAIAVLGDPLLVEGRGAAAAVNAKSM